MATSSKSNNVHHTRSISLPSGSHPTTLEIEAELNKLKSWEASSTSTAEKINNGLAGLEKLYKCIDDILSLALAQQALSHNNEKRVGRRVVGSIDEAFRCLWLYKRCHGPNQGTNQRSTISSTKKKGTVKHREQRCQSRLSEGKQRRMPKIDCSFESNRQPNWSFVPPRSRSPPPISD